MQIPSLGTRSTIRGILEGKASSFHGECFLIIFYKYQSKFSSRGGFFLVFLWRKLVFLQLHFHFLQGRNCIDGNNEDWCHFQLLNLCLLHSTLNFFGFFHSRNLKALLDSLFFFFHFWFTCISCSCFFLFLHLVLMISCVGLG